MADEAVCIRGIDIDHDYRDVPAVAGKTEDWGLVSQYGLPRTNRPVLRDGNIPFDIILRDCFCSTPRTMAVSEPIRGCGLL